MADLPTIGLKQLREIVTDAGELAKGARIVDEGGLAHLARYEHKLFADAAGSSTYKVQILFEDKGVRGRCSCMAARSRPFCKHAAALLVAWSNAPDSFPLGDKSIIARRRCPKPTPPSKWQPSASGPRWAIAPIIWLRVDGSTTAPSNRHTPAIPHIIQNAPNAIVIFGR
jgi:hypothetical protein